MGVVGEIGSGKSTLLQIIQGFYTQNSGDIIVNGSIKLEKISLSNWRNNFAVVSQHTHIFNGTIFYNISLEQNYDKDKIIDFCHKFGLHDIIAVFPQSYFTIVGEEGINLSGGQRQIIAFARALYKNPQVLLLDEVTASMDSKTERFVLDILNKIKKKTLIIFVTHKLDSLQKIADKTISL